MGGGGSGGRNLATVVLARNVLLFDLCLHPPPSISCCTAPGGLSADPPQKAAVKAPRVCLFVAALFPPTPPVRSERPGFVY